MCDVSLGAAFIETVPTPSPGTLLGLRFRLPSAGAPIDRTAVVRHTRHGEGLQ